VATCSSCFVGARLIRGAARMGIGGVSSSRPYRVKTSRRSVTWHSEQMKVWCSKPRTAIVLSGTTCVRINSAPHAVQRIVRTQLSSAHRWAAL
jgi:hypothetical protein